MRWNMASLDPKKIDPLTSSTSSWGQRRFEWVATDSKRRGEASGLGESALFYLAFILFIISFAIISFAKFYFLKGANK